MSHSVTLEIAQFYETGTFNNQARRSLTSNIDHGQLTTLQQATNYGQNLSSAAIARAGSGLVSLNASPETSVNIINSWQTNRWRFFFKLVLQQNLSGTVIRNCIYLTGYTDHGDITYNNTLDPNMLLVINGRINVREIHNGGTINTAIVTNEQILRGYANQGGHNAQRDYTLRPTDILNGIGTQMLLSHATNGFGNDYGLGPENVMMTSNVFSNGFLSSHRGNNSGAGHLSRVLNATRGGFDGQGNSDDMAMIMQQSSALSEETHIANDPMWQILTRLTDGHFSQEGLLMWRDIQRLCPNAENLAEVFKYGGVMATDPIPQTGDSEVWTGVTPEQHMSALIATTLPGIMSQQFIGRAGLLITNRTGQAEILITEPPRSMIANLDISSMVAKLIRDVMCEITPILTCNNQRLIEAHVTCDVVAHTRISISIDGGPFIDFTSPTFADSSFSPIITGNRATFDRFIADMTNLATNVFDVPGTAYTNQPAPMSSLYGERPMQQPIITDLSQVPSNLNKYF